MKDKSVFELATRLNELTKELNGLELREITLIHEYDEIVYELWRRIPTLKDDADIQPKRKVRIRNGNER